MEGPSELGPEGCRSLWQSSRRGWSEQRRGDGKVKRTLKELKRSLIWWHLGEKWEGKGRLGRSPAESGGSSSCIELDPRQNLCSLAWFPLKTRDWLNRLFNSLSNSASVFHCLGNLHSPLATSYVCPQGKQTFPSSAHPSFQLLSKP